MSVRVCDASGVLITNLVLRVCVCVPSVYFVTSPSPQPRPALFLTCTQTNTHEQ